MTGRPEPPEAGFRFELFRQSLKGEKGGARLPLRAFLTRGV